MDLIVIEEDLNDIDTINSAVSMVRYFVDKKNHMQELLLRWKYKDCANLAEKTCNDYKIFKSKNIESFDQVCDLALHSYEAGFQLLIILAKIRDKQVKIDEINLLEIKTLIFESYKCKEYPGLFCMLAGRFSQMFIENNYFEIARIFNILSMDAFKILEINGMKFNFFRSIGITSNISAVEALHFRLNDELQYLIRVFEQSIFIKHQPNLRTQKKILKDFEFQDLLSIMEVIPCNELPKIIRTSAEAQEFFEIILSKLNELQLCLKNQHLLEKDKMYSTIVDITSIFNKYWYGLSYHYLALFCDDITKKISLMHTSMAFFDELKKMNFTQKHLKYYHQIHPNENALSIYCNLLEKSILTLGFIIRYRCGTFLVFPGSSMVLETINDDRKKVITLMKESLAYMEMSGTNDKDRVNKYYEIAMHLRSIITDKKAEQENLKESEIYIKMFVNSLVKDFKCYFAVFGRQRQQAQVVLEWKNLDGEFKNEYFRRYINGIDNHDFIKKLRV